MISKEEVKHIAELARLELSEKEIEKMQKDLSAILDYFALLKKVPASRPKGYPATAGEAQKIDNSLRRDEVRKSDLADRLVSASPDKKDGYIKVKSIL